jgi:2-dehydropantoate 2-reductase
VKICIFGAGAIGGYLAGLLAASGVETSVVARGPHLAAIRASGLRVEMPERQVQARLAASDDPAELGPQDVVIVTVKVPALPSVAGAIAPLLRPDTPVAFVTNGIPWWYFRRHGGAWEGRRIARLDPGGKLWEQVGPDRVIGGIAWPASSVPEPGVRVLSGETLGTTFGEPDGTLSPRVQSLAEVFRAAGLPVAVSTTIRDLIWQKLIFNLSAGPMCVLRHGGWLRKLTRWRAPWAGRRRWIWTAFWALINGLATGQASCRISRPAGQWRSTRSTRFSRSLPAWWLYRRLPWTCCSH